MYSESSFNSKITKSSLQTNIQTGRELGLHTIELPLSWDRQVFNTVKLYFLWSYRIMVMSFLLIVLILH